MKFDHLREMRRRNGFVQSRPAFRFVEGFSDRLTRKLHAASFVERDEAIQPMQVIAIESSTHVEKERANHWQESVDQKLARNLRSARRCQNHSASSAKFIGTKMN